MAFSFPTQERTSAAPPSWLLAPLQHDVQTLGNAVDRQDIRRGFERSGSLRHSVHGARRLVLSDRVVACVAQRLEPERAVLTHPRQQDSDRSALPNLDDAVKKH